MTPASLSSGWRMDSWYAATDICAGFFELVGRLAPLACDCDCRPVFAGRTRSGFMYFFMSGGRRLDDDPAAGSVGCAVTADERALALGEAGPRDIPPIMAVTDCDMFAAV